MKLGLLILLFVATSLVRVLAHQERGVASVYSTDSGARTASGTALDPGALTAAHRSLPFGSRVRVTNRRNGRTVVVTINDRGPFIAGRIIDLTPATARVIGVSGLASVTLDVEYEYKAQSVRRRIGKKHRVLLSGGALAHHVLRHRATRKGNIEKRSLSLR